MRHLRVFVSSPGDVVDERQSAHQILLTLPEEPAWQGKIGIQVVRWDNPRSPTPMYANYTPQEAVNRNLPKPSECDLVVLLLWSRFGTPLAEPLKSDGTRYLSGTEWEYENAISGNVPVLLYRRTDDPQVSLRDPEVAEKQRQLILVDSFFERFKGPEGAATGGYITYKLADFDKLFRRVIESTFRQFIESERESHLPPAALRIIDQLSRELEEKEKEVARLRDILILRETPTESQGYRQIDGDIQRSIDVEVAHIDSRKAGELTRRSDVVATAPVLPMKLVAPFKESGEREISGASWGVSAVGADTSPFTGQGVVVAILDTGIDTAHPAFAGVEFIEKDFTGEGNGDRHGHGTHFAGIVFGQNIEGIRIGIARGVKKALIGKVIGTQGGSTDTLVSAIQWAVEEGADVIAMSVTFDFFTFERELLLTGLTPELAKLRSLEAYRANGRLFETLMSLIRAHGAFSRSAPIVAAAAGNDSQQAMNVEAPVSLPAASEGILSVAALTKAPDGLRIAPFSNSGALMFAPGSRIQSADAGGGLTALSGTSMAAAHVVGVAALWVEKLRSTDKLIRSDQVMSCLVASATHEGLRDSIASIEVGVGLVRAPQE